MKKVFLHAYDKQNLGDDLFVRTITARYPHVRFYWRTEDANRQTFSDVPNLKVISPEPAAARLLKSIRDSLAVRFLRWQEKRCDASVYIGGSIFMEYPQWRQFCEGWTFRAENYRFFALGANFGPYHDPDYPPAMGQIFQKMQDVCFRDRFSYDLFPQVSTVRYAPDILFSYPMPQAAVKEKQIFVSVINCAARDEAHGLSACHHRYVTNMARLLEGYLEDGFSVVLASFCKAEGDEDGIAAILDALNRPNDPSISTLYYDGTNTLAMTTAIAESAYVIGTRFHAVVLALTAGRPVLPIIYSDKTKHLLQDLGFCGTCFDLRQEGQWDYTLSRRNYDQPQPPLDPQLRQQAQCHFEQLDILLNGR